MEITRYTIKAGIPEKLRAAVVADIHDEKYDKVLSSIRENNVDLIFITGDIFNGHRKTSVRSFQMLKDFEAITPTFMSLGNHETVGYNEVKAAAKEAGIELLEDRSIRFKGLNIGGLTSGYVFEREYLRQNHFRKTPEPRLDWLREYAAEDGFKVLLCHHPEYFVRYVRETSVDLILSGHAHGGQWRVFGHPLFAPGQGLFPKYAQGFHEGRLIVSRGLANNAPVPRFFNQRELIYIDFE